MMISVLLMMQYIFPTGHQLCLRAITSHEVLATHSLFTKYKLFTLWIFTSKNNTYVKCSAPGDGTTKWVTDVTSIKVGILLRISVCVVLATEISFTIVAHKF